MSFDDFMRMMLEAKSDIYNLDSALFDDILTCIENPVTFNTFKKVWNSLPNFESIKEIFETSGIQGFKIYRPLDEKALTFDIEQGAFKTVLLERIISKYDMMCNDINNFEMDLSESKVLSIIKESPDLETLHQDAVELQGKYLYF